MPKKRKVPIDWVEYTPLGQCIPDTPFIASKTPLSAKLCSRLPSVDHHFTPVQLVKEIASCGHRLRKVVDLTATVRYYDADEFKTFNVEYVKIPTPGGSLPRIALLWEFADEVKAFKKRWRHWLDDGSVICVHCTHGVNRAGYFICKYLINYEGWHAEEAIRQFETYRGHKFEFPYFIEDVLNSDPSCLLQT
ncbi:hypothetical protein M514_09174 [Trichuris suis]|uniref:Tyrosine specific protein phosphatases domain-containing protein n=1 Tax=Trichuris suis TaxID=68888 RepID=A0A085MZR9_9BILA|nr:hypothetical protein M513_09174 [Trichuris suis]KFD62715.1 hypothetical protein M514_09174 [Trichuris suis]KHJ46647.1 putative tyrosine-protein phosphatase [Trichuris suis]